MNTEESKELVQPVADEQQIEKKERRTKQEKETATEAAATQLELELKRGYREIDVPGIGALHIYKPTIEINHQASLVYSREYTRLMQDEELMTHEEYLPLVEKRTGLTRNKIQDFAKASAEARIELEEAQQLFEQNRRDIKLRGRVKKSREANDEAYEKFLKANIQFERLMSVTIESRAEERRLQYRMLRCVKMADTGQQLWKSAEEFDALKDEAPYDTILFEFITFDKGIDPRLLQKVPTLLKSGGDDD